jgi:hypothetical protein
MGGQENGGLVDLLGNYLPVQYRFVVPWLGRSDASLPSARYFLVFFGISSFRAFVITGFPC